MAKAKPKSPFTGRWRIVSMSAWDMHYIDAEEEGGFTPTRTSLLSHHPG